VLTSGRVPISPAGRRRLLTRVSGFRETGDDDSGHDELHSAHWSPIGLSSPIGPARRGDAVSSTPPLPQRAAPPDVSPRRRLIRCRGESSSVTTRRLDRGSIGQCVRATMSRRRRCRAGPDRLAAVPEEILQDILVRLPAKSVLRCRAVCQLWRRLASNPAFLLDHHRRQPELGLIRSYRVSDGADTFPRLESLHLRGAEFRPVFGFPEQFGSRFPVRASPATASSSPASASADPTMLCTCLTWVVSSLRPPARMT
jgi:hypothetical protein